MTFVYMLNDIIGWIALGTGVVGILLLFFIARILDKVADGEKRREEREKENARRGEQDDNN